MNRFAGTVILVLLSGLKADAQFYDAGPLYHTPSYASNAIGRYYPVSGSGFYMQQPSGFGIVARGAGAIPPTYIPNGVVVANSYAPGYLYNDAVYGSIHAYSSVSGAMYSAAPVYVYRPGLIHRRP